jgi:hypothetical protein
MIVGSCAKKQVIGIDAASIVARMANAKLIRKGTMMQFPGSTMGIHHHSRSVSADSSIAVAADVALPQPAFMERTRGDIFPESDRHRPAAVMLKIAKRLSFYLSKFRDGFSGNLRLLPTTTLAISIGNVVRGWYNEILLTQDKTDKLWGGAGPVSVAELFEMVHDAISIPPPIIAHLYRR